MSRWDETADFVIVGSGGGSFCAAIALRDAGRTPLIIEKTDKVGGSTSMSGGIFWIPNHPLQRAAGVDDSYEKSRTYFDAVVGEVGPSTSPARKDMFLRAGPQMVEYLQKKGMPFLRADGWSDYQDELPGGCARGRSLTVEIFDLNELGSLWSSRLRRGPFDLPIRNMEVRRMALMNCNFDGKLAIAAIGMRVLKNKLFGTQLVGLGTAIQGRMLQMALKQNVDIRLESTLVEVVEEHGEIVGVVVRSEGRERRIEARAGVLLNAGGFAHNADMRRSYGPQPSSVAWTNANPGDTGEVIQIAQAHGAALDLMDQAVWLPTSLPPNGFRAFHVIDIAKPHAIIVDRDGQRFLNEGQSYMSDGQAMYARGAIPAFAIFDSQHRQRYPWSAAPGGKTPPEWLESGYLKKAATIKELATTCGIDADGLQRTVERFNGFCSSGKDLDFKRGDRAYDRIFADPSVKPNPALGPISKAPYYAVELFPGDVGTYGGLVTDEFARVLRQDGSVIPRLYATGNTTASVTGKTYPGAGASIAASFVFGWVAARHAIGEIK